ncbi:MAG TPA: nucleotide exchange factor GrpE [Acidimicrobiales bacterium]|jgi:molecular chaperone GrpE
MSLYGERPHAEDAVEGTEPDGVAATEEAAAPVGAEEQGPGAAAAEVLDPVAVLARERDEYLLALQRTQADFENYRKRITRQQGEQTARAASDLVNKLLPVLDTLDLAEAHFHESLDLTEDGKALRASRAMLMDILAKEGLERVDQRNVPFDPSVHDAVAHTEGVAGDPETMVDEVLRSGYRWKGQVLRPAMVRVRG